MSTETNTHTSSTEDDYYVDGRVQLRAALGDIKRRKPRRANITWRHNAKKSDDNLPDIVVPEGTVLTITVSSGIPSLVLVGGYLIFDARSSWGNAITVRGGTLHVITDRQQGFPWRKVTVRVTPKDGTVPGRVTTTAVEVAEGSRMSVWGQDHKETPDVVQEDGTGLPVSWPQPGTHRRKVWLTWSETAMYSQEVEIDVPDGYEGPLDWLIDVDDQPDTVDDDTDLTEIPAGYRSNWLERADFRDVEEVHDREISEVRPL